MVESKFFRYIFWEIYSTAHFFCDIHRRAKISKCDEPEIPFAFYSFIYINRILIHSYIWASFHLVVFKDSLYINSLSKGNFWVSHKSINRSNYVWEKRKFLIFFQFNKTVRNCRTPTLWVNDWYAARERRLSSEWFWSSSLATGNSQLLIFNRIEIIHFTFNFVKLRRRSYFSWQYQQSYIVFDCRNC